MARIYCGLSKREGVACNDGSIAARHNPSLNILILHVITTLEAQAIKEPNKAPFQKAKLQNDRKHNQLIISIKSDRHARV